ncbi:META domain-containing protein [Azomonas macrocytogenes]|uniref:Heat shock protein HslJ n=1 Tax=Azomonas macrocytogenes TaxID=69962 RepID=A0A839TBI9_AZOMA|nr:META domain-containing protein [Azomonas macrocytogenes]MBB3104963.1 heat shock protein HslJ [Azomonas macrocytogenes]
MNHYRLATLILGLTGCAASPPSVQEDVTYIAEWIGADPIIGQRQVSLTFSEGRAYGNTGCNHWFATYSLEQKQLRFSNIGSTRKACTEELNRQERHFLNLLAHVEHWDISSIDQLRLWPVQGKPLRFWPGQND